MNKSSEKVFQRQVENNNLSSRTAIQQSVPDDYRDNAQDKCGRFPHLKGFSANRQNQRFGFFSLYPRLPVPCGDHTGLTEAVGRLPIISMSPLQKGNLTAIP